MRLILVLTFLFSTIVFADSKKDVCSNYKNQRKCESTEAVGNKCKWHKSKGICKNEDILKAETGEGEKGFNATDDESEDYLKKPKSKDKKKKKH